MACQESGGLPASSPQDHRGATDPPHPGQQECQCPSPGLLPATLAQPADLCLGPSPSSSDTSRISSTVSGKLMRCLSPTDCGSRAESEEVTSLCSPHSPLFTPRLSCLCLRLPGCALWTFARLLPAPALLHRVPSQSPGAHRDVSFLCDNLEHICDGDVAKPLCNGQRSGAILCGEEGRGQQQPWGSPGRCQSLPWGKEVQASAVLTVLISLGEAPCFSSSVTTSVCPCCAAWCRGVYPSCKGGQRVLPSVLGVC